jgi:predicted alpha/beta-hydrolase family hydrolase
MEARMNTGFLIDGPESAALTMLLAHGAGAPMDSKSMNAATEALVAAGLRVARFEFAYMAARRTTGTSKPPPKAETLNPEYRDAVARLGASGKLIIGGKSMGGRVASMVADDLLATGAISGLLDKPRILHLADLKTPTLICQGTRDEFGTRPEVEAYTLSDAIEILWLEDGDHDLKPRKKISGFSAADHLAAMAQTVKHWAERL